jgi:hypothetical protein
MHGPDQTCCRLTFDWCCSRRQGSDLIKHKREIKASWLWLRYKFNNKLGSFQLQLQLNKPQDTFLQAGKADFLLIVQLNEQLTLVDKTK